MTDDERKKLQAERDRVREAYAEHIHAAARLARDRRRLDALLGKEDKGEHAD